MKKLRDLKNKFREAKGISTVFEKMSGLSRSIDSLKKEAEEVHRRIQNRARESQIKHEEILALSKEIDDMKVKEEEAFQKFVQFKKQFNEINEQLKQKLREMSEIKEELDKHNLETKEEKRKKEEKFLKDKEDYVENKIKRGEKLTTEDFLIFQKVGR